MGLRRWDRLLVVALVALWVANPGKVCAQLLTLNKTGTTNGTTLQLSVTLKQGQKYAAVNPLVGLTVNGVKIDVTKCGTKLNGTTNVLTINTIPLALPPGTYPVMAVIGVQGQGNLPVAGPVMFGGGMCPPPCCPPPCPPGCPPPEE